MTTTNPTQAPKVLKYMRETLRIVWQDGSVDCVRSRYTHLLDNQIPFFLAAAQRRRRKAGRTDELKQVFIGLDMNYCHREWDLATKTWVEMRETACHDCGQPMRHKLSDRMGEVWDWTILGWVPKQLYLRTQFERHTCTPRQAPVEGTTYRATKNAAGAVPGLIGSYSIEWRDSRGKLIGGLMSSRAACEQQLRIWGFAGPINWTTK